MSCVMGHSHITTCVVMNYMRFLMLTIVQTCSPKSRFPSTENQTIGLVLPHTLNLVVQFRWLTVQTAVQNRILTPLILKQTISKTSSPGYRPLSWQGESQHITISSLTSTSNKGKTYPYHKNMASVYIKIQSLVEDFECIEKSMECSSVSLGLCCKALGNIWHQWKPNRRTIHCHQENCPYFKNHTVGYRVHYFRVLSHQLSIWPRDWSHWIYWETSDPQISTYWSLLSPHVVVPGAVQSLVHHHFHNLPLHLSCLAETLKSGLHCDQAWEWAQGECWRLSVTDGFLHYANPWGH